MTADELHEREKQSFWKWRRSLVSSETNVTMSITPYEKNLNVWRQLWRVIEKSDIIVQIVDARNPLMFRSQDLEAYVHEVDPLKRNVLLVNKADLLTRKQRFKWATYFKHMNIRAIFFSAAMAQNELDEMEDNGEALAASESLAAAKTTITTPNNKNDAACIPHPVDQQDMTHVYTRTELLTYFMSISNKSSGGGVVVAVGMVGYPNVGKSSVVNVLCGRKRVAVGSTPGKTKHLQTLHISEHIMICDCPGLVFPSALTTKDDMVCDGILPIDQMREHRGPIALLCQRIPPHVFETIYGIQFQKKRNDQSSWKQQQPLGVEELLYTFATSRGMMSQKGVPNAPAAARILLKDYVNGKLY